MPRTRYGATLNYVQTQNLTLSLPSAYVRRAKILAARRGKSVSRLLAEMLKDMIERDSGYTAAKERSLALLAEGWDLGTGGHVGWSRDQLHER
jgi:hypothetical protein